MVCSNNANVTKTTWRHLTLSLKVTENIFIYFIFFLLKLTHDVYKIITKKQIDGLYIFFPNHKCENKLFYLSKLAWFFFFPYFVLYIPLGNINRTPIPSSCSPITYSYSLILPDYTPNLLVSINIYIPYIPLNTFIILVLC